MTSLEPRISVLYIPCKSPRQFVEIYVTNQQFQDLEATKASLYLGLVRSCPNGNVIYKKLTRHTQGITASELLSRPLV